jgi:general secretion pathway protein L
LTTLYIRHPARAEGEHALSRFALVGDGGAIEQQGEGALRNLGDLVGRQPPRGAAAGRGRRHLLSVQAPPLSGARLKAALPGLVEEHILGDPEDCVLVAAPQQPDGSRPIAVVDRDWLEAAGAQPAGAGRARGGRRAGAAVPAAAAGQRQRRHRGHRTDLRQGLYQGLGLALDAVPAVVLQTARAFSGDAPLVLYVPRASWANTRRWRPKPAPASRSKPTTGRTGSPARRAPRSTW